MFQNVSRCLELLSELIQYSKSFWFTSLTSPHLYSWFVYFSTFLNYCRCNWGYCQVRLRDQSVSYRVEVSVDWINLKIYLFRWFFINLFYSLVHHPLILSFIILLVFSSNSDIHFITHILIIHTPFHPISSIENYCGLDQQHHNHFILFIIFHLFFWLSSHLFPHLLHNLFHHLFTQFSPQYWESLWTRPATAYGIPHEIYLPRNVIVAHTRCVGLTVTWLP